MKKGGIPCTKILNFLSWKWIFWPKKVTAHDVCFVVQGYKTCFLSSLWVYCFYLGKCWGKFDHKALSSSNCPGSFFPFYYRGLLKESISIQVIMVILNMRSCADLRDIMRITWGSKFTWHLNEEFSYLASGSGHGNYRLIFILNPSSLKNCHCFAAV